MTDGTHSAFSAGEYRCARHVESPIMPSSNAVSEISSQSNSGARRQVSFGRRFLLLLNPSREHTAFSATILFATAILLSRVVGFLREMYIAWAFGATQITDAYNAGFTIPDWVNYLAAGGTASITFIS